MISWELLVDGYLIVKFWKENMTAYIFVYPLTIIGPEICVSKMQLHFESGDLHKFETQHC